MRAGDYVELLHSREHEDQAYAAGDLGRVLFVGPRPIGLLVRFDGRPDVWLPEDQVQQFEETE